MDFHESVIINIHVWIGVRMVNDFRLRIKSMGIHFSSSTHYTARLALIKKNMRSNSDAFLPVFAWFIC